MSLKDAFGRLLLDIFENSDISLEDLLNISGSTYSEKSMTVIRNSRKFGTTLGSSYKV